MSLKISVSCIALVSAHAATLVGSQACKPCHAEIYARWSKTRMANIVRDPRQHPESIVADFTTPNPLVTFRPSDVDLVYGSKWKQRYFYKRGNDFYIYPAQWDVQNRVWRPYHPGPGTDWWVAFYKQDQAERPTGPLCDGCHSVGYDIRTHEVSEWNVGCEKCHGPGSDHVHAPSSTNIVNPKRLDYVRANDICLQCHTQGRPLQNPIAGQYYDWPVGFTAGERLADYWKLEEHKLGEASFTHFPDGTAHKNRMQGNDYVQSVMYRRGITCFACHDVHGTANNADLIRPADVICLTCHNPLSPMGPSISAVDHSHHGANSAGADCRGCHMPLIEQTIANIDVRSHTFRFIPPAVTVEYKEPNSCNSCHKNRDPNWAGQQLSKWSNVSPWRME